MATERRPRSDEKYTIGNIDTVKRRFLLAFCDFTRKKGTVDAATLIAEFAGRQIEGTRSTLPRVHRYIRYAIPRTVQEGEVSRIRFSPGSIVATPGVLEAFRASGDDPMVYLVRHLAGNWGDVDEHDIARMNSSSSTAGVCSPRTRSAQA